MNVNTKNHNKSSFEIFQLLFKKGTEAKTTRPAGKSLSEATISGPAALTKGAIAAIEVPQRAKGKIIKNQFQMTNIRSESNLLFKINKVMHKLNDLALETKIQKEDGTNLY
jgi:hypothetical protein